MQRELFPEMLTEKEVQAQLIKLLLAAGWVVVRVNSGRFNGKSYFRSYIIENYNESAGFPDIVAFKGSRFLLIEVKRGKGGKLRESQDKFIALCEYHNIEVYIINNAEDLEKLLFEL